MPSASTSQLGNISIVTMLSLPITWASVGANTTAEQTTAVPGLLVGDLVVVMKPTTQAGIGIVGSRVSANGTLAVTFGNWTGGGLTPTAAERYTILVARFENQNVQNPPGALV